MRVQTDSMFQSHRTMPRHLSTALQRNLPGLMALYEENYIRLRRLVPRLPAAGETRTSCVPGCIDLHLEVLERAPYTTTLRLTYCFVEEDGIRREPDLLLRIHHDARTAEAMNIHLPRGRYRFEARRTLHRCWERNRFLHRWLGYCLYRGHCFDVRDAPPVAVSSASGEFS